ncbi:hypothetical protein [Mycobacteroides abscessus]|uniref:hypothetical protein n=1 Tax=Mycobacteroides abscessus TaxID=36809 RepID=UPI0009D10B18|nr:hypothetical protein [Mycobacteroides abscessus]SKX52621.1 Uncharacterised protein [Mycobacteroides abscessus subsp. bolletii]
MAPVNIDLGALPTAMGEVNDCLAKTCSQFSQMHEALASLAGNLHNSPNAAEIHSTAKKIDDELHVIYRAMGDAHDKVYESGNALLAAAGKDPMPKHDAPAPWPEMEPHRGNDDVITYDPAALDHYADAARAAQGAGTVAQDIKQLFEVTIPSAFGAQASQAISAEYNTINANFEEVNADLEKLVGQTAGDDMNDLFALDARLGG